MAARIVVACGSGVATSHTVANKISKLLAARGIEADVVAVDLGSLETAPTFDPISHLVYAAGREQVSHVWVNGKPLLSDRQLTTLNTETLLGRSNDWQGRIRAGASN